MAFAILDVLAATAVKVVLLAIASGTISSAQKDPHWLQNRSAVVHLFEWRFDDIADECERFLAPRGFAAVQISPVAENVVIADRWVWWDRYQPISYKIISRSGDERGLADMVRRCNEVGVRIYVDVILNHMTSTIVNAVGYGGSRADTFNKEYYAVPYGARDFHTTCGITNENDHDQVRDCELLGLHDLNQSRDYVRQKIIDFLNELVDHGVAGFRVDAAKYIYPSDLEYIYSHVHDLNKDFGFPLGSRPFFYQEVTDSVPGGVSKAEYTSFGVVTEFKYGAELGNAFRGNNPIKFLRNFGPQWGFLPDDDALAFIDNHDTQRSQGTATLTYKESKLYKMSVAFMLAWPYGIPRVMSSYYFDDSDVGPPADANGNVLHVTVNEDNTCGNGWVCEHRWRQIYEMVAFRNDVEGTAVTNWWDNGSKQIAFCRGNKGFIAFNDEYNVDFKQILQTCLPAGNYRDVISEKTVTVNGNGEAYIEILSAEEDGVLAIRLGSKL